MLDSRAKQEDIIRITNNAYARAEKEYAKKVASLEQQLQDKTLSEENYRQQLLELQTGFEKYESLISDMAERYASTDYATVDSLNAAINIAIENADLERADSLISTVGSLAAWSGKARRRWLTPLKGRKSALKSSSRLPGI